MVLLHNKGFHPLDEHKVFLKLELLFKKESASWELEQHTISLGFCLQQCVRFGGLEEEMQPLEWTAW